MPAYRLIIAHLFLCIVMYIIDLHLLMQGMSNVNVNSLVHIQNDANHSNKFCVFCMMSHASKNTNSHKMYTVHTYTPTDKSQWDRNGSI